MLSRIFLGKQQLGSTRAQFFFGTRKNPFEDECEICEPDVPYISGHNPVFVHLSRRLVARGRSPNVLISGSHFPVCQSPPH